jgi:hypothetical protein
VVSVREQVRLKLIGDGTDPWADNVLELEGARTSEQLPSPIETGQATGVPFVIVRLGPQTPGQTWGNLGDSIDVWPYAGDETWQELDALCGLVLLRLDNAIVTDTDGTSYQLNYGGVSTQDTPVAEWDAYTRPLRFDSVKLSWMEPTHPLADAFEEWTAKIFPLAQTDPANWVPSDASPGIYWRVTDIPRVQSADDHYNIWLDLMRSSLVGHIITPNQKTVVQYLDHLAAVLPRASIHYANTHLATIEVTRADPEADPHVDGQISVDVSFGALNGDYWAGVPGDSNQPWVPLDPEFPWMKYPTRIPLNYAEIRDGVLVGQSPTLEQGELRARAHGKATTSGAPTTS